MTTPKDDEPVYIPATLQDVARGVLAIRKAIDKPNEAMRELAQEFRRLAAEAEKEADAINTLKDTNWYIWEQRRVAFTQAAQMLEERLNG
jgi:hypothetical protein